jgi:hypothetical protein
MSESKSNVNKLLLILVIIQFAGIAYLLMNSSQKSELIESQIATIEEKETLIGKQAAQLDSLDQDIENKIEELSKLGQDYQSLVELKNQIAQERDQLKKSGNLSASKIKDLNERIKGYVAQLEEKEIMINELKAKNEAQAQEITGLESKNAQLADSLGTAKTKNAELVDKVTLASILRIENLKIAALNKKSKEKTDDENEFKASRIEKLKIAFNLGDNKVAPKGNKTVYLKIVNSKGVTLTETSSGTFMFDDKETYYTSKQTIAFDNSNQTVIFYYSKTVDFEKGKHIVEVYEGGYKIGEGNFIVK